MIAGEVFGKELREVRGGLRILSFNVTDYDGSLRVSRRLQEGDEGLNAVEDGMFIIAAGDVSYDRWHGDISMAPTGILRLPAPKRTDDAPGEKRVELHAHSRYSQLDGLTDITKLVKTAARWGHRAVALTDHGVLQGYPELCSAGKAAGIKVIYGVEGYFVNDVDDRVAVSTLRLQLVQPDPDVIPEIIDGKADGGHQQSGKQSLNDGCRRDFLHGTDLHYTISTLLYRMPGAFSSKLEKMSGEITGRHGAYFC